jgi:hypothetical protein
MADYRFPENLPGKPVVENNFNSIDFLAKGGYTSSAGTLVSVLNPWPSNVVPVQPCAILPIAVPGGPYTAASGGSITLNGSANTSDNPVTFLWTAPQGTFSNATLANPVYTAPVVATLTNIPLTLTVTTCAGSGSATVNVAVNGASAPTVNHVAPLTVFSGAAGSMPVTGSDPNVPPALPLVFTATQAGAPALLNFNVTQGPNPPGTGATITFTAPTLPVGQITSNVINLTITATNSANVPSASEFTTVTVVPLPDAIGHAGLQQYRLNNRRLILNATSSVVSPNVVLKLQPYVTTTGTTYNPDPAAGGVGNTFTNAGGGVYTLTLNGVPEPACGNPNGNVAPCPTAPLDVKSNLNGDSGFFSLTDIRQ